jgi:SAM-dependent methyltransferase
MQQSASPWVQRWAHQVPTEGVVLDLACGYGRHARLFAAQGHRVLALDRDAEALASLADVANIETLQADLEQGAWPLGMQRFAAIVVSNYLHRPLWPHLLAALDHNALLIYETFMLGNEKYGKPSNPDFLLRPGELLQAVNAMHVLAFEQGRVNSPKAAVVQRICAATRTDPDLSLD